MRKIPTVFVRDETVRGHPVTPVVKPECAWVFTDPGVVATAKLDGQNVRLAEVTRSGAGTIRLDGVDTDLDEVSIALMRAVTRGPGPFDPEDPSTIRYALLKRRKPPEGVDYSEASYVPCRSGDPADKWLWTALSNTTKGVLLPEPVAAVYEAVGPHFGQGNPHHFVDDLLVRVVPCDPSLVLPGFPGTFDGLRAFFESGARVNLFGGEVVGAATGAPIPMPVHPTVPEGIVWLHPDGRMAKLKRRDFGLPWPHKEG